MRVHGVNPRVGRQRRLHLLPGVGLEPFHLAAEHDRQPGMALEIETLEQPLVAILSGRRGHEPFQLDDLSLPAERLADPSPSLASDLHVVGANERRVLLALDRTIQDDHRDALAARVGDGPGERRGLLGGDDDQVHTLLDELFDLRALRQGVVLRVLEDHPQVVVAGGRGADVRVHLHAPGLAQVALAHADHPRVGRRAGVPRARPLAAPGESQRADEGTDGKAAEKIGHSAAWGVSQS